MPSKSKKQQKAAGADLKRVRQGKAPKTFLGMSEEKLRHYAKSRSK